MDVNNICDCLGNRDQRFVETVLFVRLKSPLRQNRLDDLRPLDAGEPRIQALELDA